jgi:hypothetical protein
LEKTRKIITILTLALAFCFLRTSLAQAQCLTPSQAGHYFPNAIRAVSKPIWQITQEGTAMSVQWMDYTLNPRFAIYDSGTLGDESDDLILDKETGLVWTRDAGHGAIKYSPRNRKTWQKTWPWQIPVYYCSEIWHNAINYCRDLTVGNRKGWRLPTVEELSSIVDPSQSNPALPSGHPFVDVQSTIYLSITSDDSSKCSTQGVNMFDGSVNLLKNGAGFNVWCVRGGSEYSTGNW